MSWEYQLHMCYAWYSTWAFFVYCGHLGFWGLGRLHIVHCLPEYSSCFWMRIKGIIVFFFILSSYWGKIRCVPFGEHAVQLHSVMDTVEQTQRKKMRFMFCSKNLMIWCVDLFRASRNHKVLEKKILPNVSHTMREQALIPEYLSVLHMLTVWFLPNQFISFHCNAKQHIWNHLKVFFYSFQLLISEQCP